MGIKVTDYIKQARIEYAKIALLTTKKSIQEISDSLQFGTRNYFSKVFHEIVGMTPAAYREKVGRQLSTNIFRSNSLVKERVTMSKGIKVNNGHVNEVATQIETAKSYFRHVPLVPQDSKTTISERCRD